MKIYYEYKGRKLPLKVRVESPYGKLSTKYLIAIEGNADGHVSTWDAIFPFICADEHVDILLGGRMISSYSQPPQILEEPADAQESSNNGPARASESAGESQSSSTEPLAGVAINKEIE